MTTGLIMKNIILKLLLGFILCTPANLFAMTYAAEDLQLGEREQALIDVTSAELGKHAVSDAYNMILTVEYDEASRHNQIFLLHYSSNLSQTDKPTRIQLTRSTYNKSLPTWGPRTQADLVTNVNEMVVQDAADLLSGTGTKPEYTCPVNEGVLFYYLSEITQEDIDRVSSFSSASGGTSLGSSAAFSIQKGKHINVGCIKGLTNDGTDSNPELAFSGVHLTGYSNSTAFDITGLDAGPVRLFYKGPKEPLGGGTPGTELEIFPGIFKIITNNNPLISPKHKELYEIKKAQPAYLEKFKNLTAATAMPGGSTGAFGSVTPPSGGFNYTSPNLEQAYAVTFTDSEGKLHLLLHDDQDLQSSLASRSLVVIDPRYMIRGVVNYKWNTASQTIFHRHPKFDGTGFNILFSGTYSSAGTQFELGTTSSYGTDFPSMGDRLLTKTGQDVAYPQAIFMGPFDFVFFELEKSTSNVGHLALLVLTKKTSAPYNVVSWADKIYTLSDNTLTRQHLDIQMRINKNDWTKSTYNLIYEIPSDDPGHIDSYVMPFDMTEDMNAPAVSMHTSTTSAMANVTDPSLTEIKLTCRDENTWPQMLPHNNVYVEFNADGTPASTSFEIKSLDPSLYHYGDFSLGIKDNFNDVIYIKENTSTGSQAYTNRYDFATLPECAVVPDPEPKPNPTGCTVEYLTANPSEDYDRDGVLNKDDICPCSYNPTQTDEDGDGVGETNYDLLENGCDNCPNLANPADLDNNSDGDFNPLDSDYRQSDTDRDGIGDACDMVVNECGDTDTDGDGVYDLCDNCLVVANSDQLDSDNDNIGDACEANPAPSPLPTPSPSPSPIEFGTYGGANCSLQAASTMNANWLWMLFGLVPVMVARRKQ